MCVRVLSMTREPSSRTRARCSPTVVRQSCQGVGQYQKPAPAAIRAIAAAAAKGNLRLSVRASTLCADCAWRAASPETAQAISHNAYASALAGFPLSHC